MEQLSSSLSPSCALRWLNSSSSRSALSSSANCSMRGNGMPNAQAWDIAAVNRLTNPMHTRPACPSA